MANVCEGMIGFIQNHVKILNLVFYVDIQKMSDKDQLKNYLPFLEKLKSHIQQRRLKAAFAANSQMLYLYWELGYYILQQQEQEG